MLKIKEATSEVNRALKVRSKGTSKLFRSLNVCVMNLYFKTYQVKVRLRYLSLLKEMQVVADVFTS